MAINTTEERAYDEYNSFSLYPQSANFPSLLSLSLSFEEEN
jgi:hypothetical protein